MTNNIVHHHLSRDEAVRFIKRHRRGRQCFIRISLFGYTQLPDADGNARGFDMTGLVPVGAKVAIKAIGDCVADAYVKKGVVINIGISKGCIFIG